MSDTRWLTPEEMRAWRGYLGLVRLLEDRLGRDLQGQSGLSTADYEILVRLSEAPHRQLRMTELAECAMVSKSRLSHQLNRMEASDLVRRQSCPTDRRGTLAALTEHGYRVLVAAAPGHVDSVREHLLDRLTADQVRVLGELSEAVLTALPQPWQTGCPGETVPRVTAPADAAPAGAAAGITGTPARAAVPGD